MKLLLKYMLLGGLLCISFGSNAQDLDIEAMTKDTKFKVSGGINADAMFFSSSAEKSTFTYMLTGSLNFSFLTKTESTIDSRTKTRPEVVCHKTVKTTESINAHLARIVIEVLTANCLKLPSLIY